MRIILFFLYGFVFRVSALGVASVCREYPNGTVILTPPRRNEREEMESRNLATFPESVRTTSKTPPTWKPFPRIANRRLWTTKDMVAGTTAIDTRQTDARKGHLFVYTLHSAAFFPTAVDVAWSATLKNRPALPSWLHLVPSRYKAIAYLVGQLEKSVREAFRGKDVNPYIYTVQPEFLVPQGKEHLFRNQRSRLSYFAI
ncbi:hypothetical protein Y032_0023g866 [Ancylostoma ceylanicum]|uniref:Uncharacterized protein n=1 Tax=Ancylostoma ceylanicum TaxID=53326 RepID=A0A016UYM1_9BILA|nr:hypothetical protein Y032_0023g866 [Ancylostoma ceylanicum]